ncbi:MAG: DUF4175 family protein, partial [candidate division Zixibacteria bacterium]|nr:DUF4175 family protein [candidate division Zixibacteria bacterium]
AQIESRTNLINRLRLTLLKQRLVLFGSGLATTTAAVTVIWIVLSLLAGLVVLPVAFKIAMLSLTAASMLILFIRVAMVRLFTGSVDGIVVNLEKKHSNLKGRLIAAIQFANMRETPGYSTDLIALTEKQALEKASGIRLGDAISFNSLFRAARFLIVTTIVALTILVLSPGLFSYSYEVYSHPATEIAPPLGYRLIPFPGSVEWIKYRDIEIGAVITGDMFPETATIWHRLVGGSWQKTKVDLESMHRTGLVGEDSLTVVNKLRQINRSIDYYVEAGRLKTEIQKIDVVDRPRVNGIKLSIFYPEYTGLSPTVIDENNGSFSAVVGSRVNLEVTTNLPVEMAELVFFDSSSTRLEVTDKTAGTSLRIDSSRTYYVRLIDHLGEENPDPIEYYMTAIPDEYPSIEVLRPGFNVNLGEEMLLPLKVRIFDDFGFSSLVLKYTVYSQGQLSEEHVAVLHFSDRIKTEGEVEFNWDLDALDLYPGDYVTYHFEVADNDLISGPKTTSSRQFVARFPSLEEIIAETEGESAQRVQRTENLLKTGRKITERMKNISRKLQAQQKSTLGADWQNKKELSGLTEKNADLLKNIEKTAEKMEKSIDKMSENSLMSRQIMEKMTQIQKLFEEVATEEMKEAQRKLMEALKNMNREELEKAVKNAQMSLEELLERLERTLSLLKKMELEQKMEAMIRRVEELVKKQEAVNQETDTTAKDNLPALGSSENEIKSSLQSLKKDVENLKQRALEAEMDQSSEVQKFSEALEKTDADQDMGKMEQALNMKQQAEAMEKGKTALSKLLEMLDNMQQQLASMQGGDQSEAEKAMRMALEDANYLSRNQEKLREEAAKIRSQSVMLHDVATAQQDLSNACNGLTNRISKLGKQSPFVAAGLRALVNQATRHMNLAIEGFSSRKGYQAVREQREAMVNLNLAAQLLMESLEQQSQCKKGGSCDKKLNKLQSLCNKQNKLNKECKSQCNKPGSKANPRFNKEGRMALERLAGQQEAIRKSVQDLNREFGSSRQILGRLDAITEEMKKVEEELTSGEIGPETTERQLKIYSRLLQASRSLQRRDFTEQRKATTAVSDRFHVPSPLSSGFFDDDGVKLEDKLRKFLSDEYPPQYEEQIKAYFKALLQLESEIQNTPSAGEPNRP